MKPYRAGERVLFSTLGLGREAGVVQEYTEPWFRDSRIPVMREDGVGPLWPRLVDVERRFESELHREVYEAVEKG
jgi:hypothetical protein